MPYTHNAPFRYDVVGSFLRPDVLKQARADHAAGVIDDAALKAVADGGAKLAVGTYSGTGNSTDTKTSPLYIAVLTRKPVSVNQST